MDFGTCIQPPGATPLPLESVALHPDYERMLVVVAHDGSRWHYLQNQAGDLELGRPYMVPYSHSTGKVLMIHLWCPLATGMLPRVLKVEE